MDQKTKGLYGLTQAPWFYRTFQLVLGAKGARTDLCNNYLKPRPGEKVLDLGCGPGVLRPSLGTVDYVGVDLNASHVEAARIAFPADTFICADVASLPPELDETFDLITCIGLIHHLSDATTTGLLRQAKRLLKPDGRLVTLDNVYIENQNPFARWLISRDSGQHVRIAAGYRALLDGVFGSVEEHIRHDMLRVPYTHYIAIARASVGAQPTNRQN